MVIIFASARNDGHTRKVVDALAASCHCPLINLNEKEIGFFDYANANEDDDFIPVIEEILAHELLIFASPVYWYSMSAGMKVFFERISDLLKWRKDLGRQLRGKSMAVLSCGSDGGPVQAFVAPFIETAEYLGMEFKGYVHTWIADGQIPEPVQTAMDAFAHQLRSNA